MNQVETDKQARHLVPSDILGRLTAPVCSKQLFILANTLELFHTESLFCDVNLAKNTNTTTTSAIDGAHSQIGTHTLKNRNAHSIGEWMF